MRVRALANVFGFPIHTTVNATDPKARIAALHLAASRGLKTLVSLLLERGADPNRRDAIHSATPRAFAEYCGRQEVVALFGDVQRFARPQE